MVRSATSSDSWRSRSSKRRIAAITTSTFRSGWVAVTESGSRPIEPGSVMSNVSAAMPGCAAASSSSSSRRRAATITRLPASWSRAAGPAPMPEPAPATNTVFPLIFMIGGSPAMGDRSCQVSSMRMTRSSPGRGSVPPQVARSVLDVTIHKRRPAPPRPCGSGRRCRPGARRLAGPSRAVDGRLPQPLAAERAHPQRAAGVGDPGRGGVVLSMMMLLC